MPNARFIAAAAFAGLILSPAVRAADAPPIVATELPMNPSADVMGRPLAYPAGTPVMRAYRITVAPGAATTLHLHEVPTFAYILSGTLDVDYGARGRRTYRAGEAFMEATAWCHRGHAVGDKPAVLLALYMGNAGLRNSVDCPR